MAYLYLWMVRRSRRLCERAGRSCRAKIVSLFIYGCCGDGGVPVQSVGRGSRSTAVACNLGSHLYDVRCPRRCPAHESTPLSEQLGSRTRRSSHSPVQSQSPAVGDLADIHHLTAVSILFILVQVKKQPETDGWSSSPCKFRLCEILNRNLKLKHGVKLDKICATCFL